MLPGVLMAIICGVLSDTEPRQRAHDEDEREEAFHGHDLYLIEGKGVREMRQDNQ